jgi:glc operon protein GlcG
MSQSLRALFVAVALLLSLAQSPIYAQATPTTSTPLITSGHYKLTLAGAEKILAAAKAKAAEMQLKVNVAVADDGGHLIALQRMDGARPASLYTAITKASASATLRAPTGPLPVGTKEPDVWLNLSLQIAAGQSGGKLTTLKGGVPIIMDGQVIGAVGVGGGSGEQDVEIATAGIAALELKK